MSKPAYELDHKWCRCYDHETPDEEWDEKAGLWFCWTCGAESETSMIETSLPGPLDK